MATLPGKVTSSFASKPPGALIFVNCPSRRDTTLIRLNAAQLAKHAFALRTAVHGAWAGKRPGLYYLFAEPVRWPGDKGAVSPKDRARHRAEVAALSEMVAGDCHLRGR